MGTQIWHIHEKVKGPLTVIIWTNLVDLESSMLYTKIQPKSYLGSGEEDFLRVLPYMGMAAILFNGAEPLEQISNILLTEGSMWNLVKIAQAKIAQFYRCVYPRGKGR